MCSPANTYVAAGYLQAHLQMNAISFLDVGALVYLLKAHLLQPHQCQ